MCHAYLFAMLEPSEEIKAKHNSESSHFLIQVLRAKCKHANKTSLSDHHKALKVVLHYIKKAGS